MLLGNWRNFDELEENLSYPELIAMVKAARERDHRQMKFQAALKGIDIDKNKPKDDPVERVKRKVKAKLAGVSEKEHQFRENAAAAGFKVVKE